MIRISGGELKGRKLKSPGKLAIRPTPEKVRQALFSIWQTMIPGCVFIDLCAGTGIMGIEALSRGAASAIFVDNQRAAITLIRKNLESLDLLEKGTLEQDDAVRFVAGSTLAELPGRLLVYADPPYRDFRVYRQLIEMLGAKARSGVPMELGVEHRGALPSCDTDGLSFIDEKRYGDTRVTLFTAAGSI